MDLMEKIKINNPKRGEWFSTWFDSPYYHILYQNRDEREAAFFVQRLANYLKIHPDQHILDLACGRGRHSVQLNQMGYRVTGVDLSPQSIAYARKQSNPRLDFAVHDMRQTFKPEAFDMVLNLFTSFGYFEQSSENARVVQAAAANLRAGGRLLIDFMNVETVIASMIPYEEKTLDGICFEIRKTLEQGMIIKDIRFEDAGRAYHFQERVKAIDLAEFQDYAQTAGLEILESFGNYTLEPFQAESSERLILIMEKS